MSWFAGAAYELPPDWKYAYCAVHDDLSPFAKKIDALRAMFTENQKCDPKISEVQQGFAARWHPPWPAFPSG